MSSLGSPNPFFIAGKKAYEVQRSLRFNDDDSTHLNRTPSSAGNRKTWTISFWFKRCTLSSSPDGQRVFSAYNGSDGQYQSGLKFRVTDRLQIFNMPNGSIDTNLQTNRLFRDVSAWYHIVVAVDMTQSTASDRVNIYVNGVQETSFSTENYGTQNTDWWFNNNSKQTIGRDGAYLGQKIDGYLAEVNLIDGFQYDASYFGETNAITGQWNPKKYTGSYGTNGFYLNFSDNSGTTATTLGKDSSGNGNNFTPNNFSVSAGAGNDSLEDTPTNNFCTLNPLDVYGDGVAEEIKNGNLEAKNTSGSYRMTRSTFHFTTGKWYWEVKVLNAGSATLIGVAGKDYAAGSGARRVYSTNGQKYIGSGSSYGASYTTNDIIGIALDLDNGTLTFYKNGSSQGVAFTDMLTAMVDGGWTPVFNGYNNSEGAFNFGQRAFDYTQPTGYKSLCSANLPDPTILLPNKHFDTLLYTGNGGSNSITGLQFQPDWLWIKNRGQADNHQLHDAIRGASKGLISNSTNAEYTDVNAVTAFDSNGFSMNNNYDSHNKSSETYVAWNWKAGGSASSNSDGTITSSVSVNASAGFSIISYTGNGTSGATTGHGLGVAPKIMFHKDRDASNSWYTITTAVDGSADYLYLNSATSANNSSVTAPTSSLVYFTSSTESNANGRDYIMYAFSEVAGYSKIGSYTGNGNNDGTFVFTGFKVQFLLIKKTNTSESWILADTKRNSITGRESPADSYLLADQANAESTGIIYDMLSNGFKFRSTSQNTSGHTYVYLAFAEAPFKNARAR